jgi:alkylhydroperoxidase family enzyme
METKLNPIQHPPVLIRLAYYFLRVKFGKVLTPLKVAYARLPLAFSLFSNKISSLNRKLRLPYEQALLIRHHVAQLNQCSFCMDIGIAMAIEGKAYSEKFYHLDEYASHPLYTDADRIALRFAEELTRSKHVSNETFAQARQVFSERELVEIAWLVATEHYYNVMNLAFDIHSDNLCQLKQKA